jgi:hypothetical protein
MKSKLSQILKILLWLLAVLFVASLIFQNFFENKMLLEIVVALTVSAFFFLYAIRALATGGFYIRGFEVKKEVHPGCYYFCVLLSFMTGAIVFLSRVA